MAGELLYGVNQWLLFAVVLGMLYAAAEIGYRYGKRSAHRTSEKTHSHVGTVEGALIGLLALLLGFAFAMAMTRFESRKQTVLDELNDLETAYLRAHLLPNGRRDQCQMLLLEYVDARLADLRAGTDQPLIEESHAKSQQVLQKLWALAVATARETPDEVTTGYFIESLNRLIDDDARRAAAMANHVPETILLLLLLVATLTMAVSGYSSGLRLRRLHALRLILVVLITATLTVIIDLDRPRRGLIRVSEGAIERLQRALPEFHLAVDER